MNKQPKTIDQPSNQGQATHPGTVGLQQSEWLIWEWLDCNRPYWETIN